MIAQSTGAFRRYLALLDAIAASPRAPIAEIVRRSGVSRATAYRLLAELREAGVIVEAAEGFVAGPPLVAISRWARRSLRSVALPFMEDLRDATGETVTLHIAAGRDRVCIAQVESLAEAHFAAAVDRPVRLNDGVPGKVLLSVLDDPERYYDWLATFTDPAPARSAADAIRARGYAVQDIGDFTAAAVPVPGQVACLSVVGPASRWTLDRATAAIPAILAAAGRIRDALGAVG